jgi:hypothetical protein
MRLAADPPAQALGVSLAVLVVLVAGLLLLFGAPFSATPGPPPIAADKLGPGSGHPAPLP